MKKDDQIRLMEQSGIIAIVRFDRSEQLVKVARAIKAGGVHVIEFSMNTPNAVSIIEEATREFGDEVLLGAGTVLDSETARAVILAGAEFILSPTIDPGVIEMCHRYGKVVVPGAFSPNEILKAWEFGADFVKIFPASFWGANYLKALQAPFPYIKFMPVGGVSLENVADFIKAGAPVVGVGSSLVKKRAIAEENYSDLTETARNFVSEITGARTSMSASK